MTRANIQGGKEQIAQRDSGCRVNCEDYLPGATYLLAREKVGKGVMVANV
jgi:hypothetical protein